MCVAEHFWDAGVYLFAGAQCVPLCELCVCFTSRCPSLSENGSSRVTCICKRSFHTVNLAGMWRCCFEGLFHLELFIWTWVSMIVFVWQLSLDLVSLRDSPISTRDRCCALRVKRQDVTALLAQRVRSCAFSGPLAVKEQVKKNTVVLQGASVIGFPANTAPRLSISLAFLYSFALADASEHQS